MKIDGLKPKISKTEKAKPGKKAATSKSSSKATASRVSSSFQDSVEVSDHHETLAMIRSMVAQSDDVRVDEVERIVTQLKNGKYRINFERVAEGFIKDAILNELSKKTRVKS